VDKLIMAASNNNSSVGNSSLTNGQMANQMNGAAKTRYGKVPI